MDGCFPTALGRQSTILKAAVYPWESWSEFLVAGCPSSHQPTRIRGRDAGIWEDLFSGSWISASVSCGRKFWKSHRMNFRNMLWFRSYRFQHGGWRRDRGNHREEIETGGQRQRKRQVIKPKAKRRWCWHRGSNPERSKATSETKKTK